MRHRQARERQGYRLQDYGRMSYAVHGGESPVPLSTDPAIFTAEADGTDERPASEAEQAAFRAGRNARYGMFAGGVELDTARISGAFRPPVRNRAGAAAWLAKADPSQMGHLPVLQLRASLSGAEAEAVSCTSPLCRTQMVLDLSWSGDGREVIFSAFGGPTGVDFGVHAWDPRRNRLRTIADLPDGVLRSCTVVEAELICLLAEKLRPTHVAAIDIASSARRVLADVNPEFARLNLGRVERIEWATPKTQGVGTPPRSRGYLIYPPDYDPKRVYPLFVQPYDATGFARGGPGDEQPLLVYAAHGMVVLDTDFPRDMAAIATCLGAACTLAGYDPARGYPHLESYAAGTFAAIDAAARRAHGKRSPGSILRSGATSEWPTTLRAGIGWRARMSRQRSQTAAICSAGKGR